MAGHRKEVFSLYGEGILGFSKQRIPVIIPLFLAASFPYTL